MIRAREIIEATARRGSRDSGDYSKIFRLGELSLLRECTAAEAFKSVEEAVFDDKPGKILAKEVLEASRWQSLLSSQGWHTGESCFINSSTDQ